MVVCYYSSYVRDPAIIYTFVNRADSITAISVVCNYPSYARDPAILEWECHPLIVVLQGREFPHSLQDTFTIIVSRLELLFTWDRYIVMIQHHTGGKKEQLGRPLTIDTYRFFRSLQLRIQGRGPGDPGSPLFLDQKSFFETNPPPPTLSQGLDDQALPYLKVWIHN